MSRWMPEGGRAALRRAWLSRLHCRGLTRVTPRQLFIGATACWQADGQAWPAATDWFAQHAGQRVRIVLGGAQLHHVCADPALPLADERDVRDWARHQFEHYHGPTAQGWSLAAWCEGTQRGASAVAQQTLQRLTRAAAEHRVHLQGIVPAWAPALRAAGRREPTLGSAPSALLWLVEGEVATRIELARGTVWRIDCRWLDEPTHAGLQALLQGDAADRAAGASSVPPSVTVVVGHGLHDDGPVPAGVRMMGRLDREAPDSAWWAA